MPEKQAIQPEWRPIVSTTTIRRWLSVVVRSRSTASVTMLTAVSKPKEKSATIRSLSIVLGMPTTGILEVIAQAERDAQGVVAADHDQGIELEPAKFSRRAARSVSGLR